MKRFEHILMVLLFLLVGDWTLSASSLSGGELTDDAQTVYQQFRQHKTRDGLWKYDVFEQNRSEAIITDAHSIYRICNTRPQRILSHYASRNYRVTAKLHSFFIHLSLKTTNARQYYRKVTLPVLSVASCDYYVYALRHILC